MVPFFLNLFLLLSDTAQRTAEQQFEVGTRGFLDAFASIQYKDEQVCCLECFIFFFFFSVDLILFTICSFPIANFEGFHAS